PCASRDLHSARRGRPPGQPRRGRAGPALELGAAVEPLDEERALRFREQLDLLARELGEQPPILDGHEQPAAGLILVAAGVELEDRGVDGHDVAQAALERDRAEPALESELLIERKDLALPVAIDRAQRFESLGARESNGCALQCRGNAAAAISGKDAGRAV